jgi:DNA-binding response OmpR family regulator
MALVGDQDAGLSAKEYELVEFLARRKQRVFPQQTLIETLYDSDNDVTSNVIEALVYSIRKKLARHGKPSPIRNRRGQGYFVE